MATMEQRSPLARSKDQDVKVGQTLTETWTVEYKRRGHGQKVEASLSWPHHTIYAGARGVGDTVEEARLALVAELAHAICVDEDRHGD